MKKFTFNNEECFFFISHYCNNDRIYIEIDCEDEIVCDVTVNISLADVIDDEHAYIDTANTPELKEFLTENGFAEETKYAVTNGYNTYHLYKLNLEKIKEYGLEDNYE